MIKELALSLQFDVEDAELLEQAYSQITANSAWSEAFSRARDIFFCEGKGFEAELIKVAEESGIHRYTVDLVFLLSNTRHMRYIYASHGYSEELYLAALADLHTKAVECKKTHGVCGIFVVWWYPALFTCKRFILGRLEFERLPFPMDCGEGYPKKDEIAVNCHIPSSGVLRAEDVIESLKLAYDFYRDLHKDGVLNIFCCSWLLYPPTAALYKEGSNLDRFYKMYEIFHQVEYKECIDFWRVFNMSYSPEALKNAPEDTSLRRALKAYLLQGKKMGTGYGLIRFDGEKILDKPV